MKDNLMSRMSEFCEGPKRLAADVAGQKIVYIVPDSIIGHWTLYDIVIVVFSASTHGDKIEPLIAHFRESENFQAIKFNERLLAHAARRISGGPAYSLLMALRAVESPREVFCIPGFSDLRNFNNNRAAVEHLNWHETSPHFLQIIIPYFYHASKIRKNRPQLSPWTGMQSEPVWKKKVPPH